jgi:multidrug resistance protein
MSVPGNYNNPAFGADDLKDETLKLALAEGHDADIPSNGRVYHASPEKEAQVAIATSTTTDEEGDPNIVDWEKPTDQDPANPMNWSERKKWMNIAIVSLLTLITFVFPSCFEMTVWLTNVLVRPLASSMFAPGVPQVLIDFHSTSQTLATFVVSVYLLGFAFGPLAVAPLCEIYGRLPVYFSCSVLFVIFSIACALSSSLNMLIGFRFLMGCAGVAPLTIGAGTIADIMPVERRGRAMAIYSIGPLIGPVIGPVGGGYMIEAIGWRWVYWLLAIIVSIFPFNISQLLTD